MTIIEFEAQGCDDTCIAGYMYLEDADDDEPLWFYTPEGFENGNKLPQNPYPFENNQKHFSYELLVDDFCRDTELIQYLIDYANKENVTILRDGYTLYIN